MSRRLLRQIEAALTLMYSLLTISTYAGVADLDREEIAALINKKLLRHLHIQRLQQEAGQTANIRHCNHS